MGMLGARNHINNDGRILKWIDSLDHQGKRATPLTSGASNLIRGSAASCRQISNQLGRLAKHGTPPNTTLSPKCRCNDGPRICRGVSVNHPQRVLSGSGWPTTAAHPPLRKRTMRYLLRPPPAVPYLGSNGISEKRGTTIRRAMTEEARRGGLHSQGYAINGLRHPRSRFRGWMGLGLCKRIACRTQRWWEAKACAT